MNFTPADSPSLYAFIFFAAIMALTIQFVFIKVRASLRLLLLWWSYVILFSAIVASGMPLKLIIPTVPLLFATLLGLYIYLAFSAFGKSMSLHFSMAALIGFQCFRLPLEIILHQWAVNGTIPETMTWTGQNWDIITGVVSLITIPVLNRYAKIALVVNTVGFILLINVLRVVIMSSPFPFSWALDNPLQLVLYFPYCLIGPLFVGPALFLHIIAFKKLLAELKNKSV